MRSGGRRFAVGRGAWENGGGGGGKEQLAEERCKALEARCQERRNAASSPTSIRAEIAVRRQSTNDADWG
jgi:hypothetical protein